MISWIKLSILAALVVAGIASHIFLEKRAVATAIIVTQTKIESVYKTKLIEAQEKAAKATADLNAYKVQADEEKAHAVQTITDKLNADIDSLRNRPTRADLSSSVSTAVASARKACTGSQLYRDDAEFLTRYAARAATVVVERDYYYGQYENARRKLAESGADARLNGATTDAKPFP